MEEKQPMAGQARCREQREEPGRKLKPWWSHSLIRSNLLTVCPIIQSPPRDPISRAQEALGVSRSNTLHKFAYFIKLKLKGKPYISQCFINSSKCWLLIIMVNTSVPMKNEDSFFFCFLTVASIYAMIRSVIPLTWKNKKAFYTKKNQTMKQL